MSNFEGMQPPEQLRKWIDSLLNATAGKFAGEGEVADEPEETVDPERWRPRGITLGRRANLEDGA